MSFEAMLCDRCDIYHMRTELEQMSHGLPGQALPHYPDEPDEAGVPCHFQVRGIQGHVSDDGRRRTYTADARVNFPLYADIRTNDKVVDCQSGMEYMVAIPRVIHGHHIIADVWRTAKQEPL